MSRPEHIAPADVYYDDTEARKYTRNSRIIKIQKEMAERAFDLLSLPENGGPYNILDIGCGSGLSGEVLSEMGHTWTGVDISPAMLRICLERESEGDLFECDIGCGLGFRPGVFDGAISISALQWLCQADKSDHKPRHRLMTFFNSLYGCLVSGAAAVFQLYPETPQQMELITSCAMKAGFGGGLVVDNPNSTKAKKMFLCLFTSGARALPAGLNDVSDSNIKANVFESRRNTKAKKGNNRPLVKSKEWIQKKKDKARNAGKVVANDSKYTGRKRRAKF
ncbi:hypothetical protein P9112_013089 [Eukaryota sp. TZLM1-RC]